MENRDKEKGGNPGMAIVVAVIVIAAAGFLLSRSVHNQSEDEALKLLSVGDEEADSAGKNEVKSDPAPAEKTLQALRVDPHRCIGCGKCARWDVEHFEMRGGIAEVISQNNLTSASLEDARNRCPTQAISLS